jgi:hypothetical protein
VLPKRGDPNFPLIKAKLNHINFRVRRINPPEGTDLCPIDGIIKDIEEMLLTLREIEGLIPNVSEQPDNKDPELTRVEEEPSNIHTEDQLFNHFLERFSMLPTPGSSPHSLAKRQLAGIAENRKSPSFPNIGQQSNKFTSTSSPNQGNRTTHIKTIPIQKWGIVFQGGNLGLSVKDFLSQIEIWAHSQKVSETELLASAFLFFEGDAKIWYRAFYSKFQCWSDLVNSLEKQFLPSDYDFWLKKEIENRQQGINENFGIYLAAMELLFSNLSEPLIELEKLKILRRNMLPHYKPHLSFMPIRNIQQLLSCCRIVDDTKEEIDRQKAPTSHNRNLLEPALSNPNIKRRVRVNELDQTDIDENSNDGELNALIRQSELHCYNCGIKGHHFRDCRLQRKIFCYRCGKTGAYLSNCPKCNNSGNSEVKPAESGVPQVSPKK